MRYEIVSTGVAGLDEVLLGGLPRNQMYFVQGDPGAGKTTLSLQFLLEGVRRGEKSMYVTLAASRRDLERVAHSHGWNIEGLIIEEQLRDAKANIEKETTLYHPGEVELARTVQAILDAIARVAPARVVIDSLAEIRLLSESALRYRKQLLMIKQFLREQNVTAVVIDDRSLAARDSEIQGLAEGVIVLEREAPVYGAPRRRLEVVKLRGVNYHGGYHDFAIDRGGLQVFPRLIAAEHEGRQVTGSISSGVKEIDELTGGGLDRGSGAVIMGPAGVGKSALATQFAVTAARAGDHVAMFLFDETRSTLLSRSASLGFGVQELIDSERLYVEQIDPAQMSAGEFSYVIRRSIEKYNTSVLVIDSLNGFVNAMPEVRFLTVHLHELLTYLSHKGVMTLLVLAQHGVLGAITSSIDVSYLADSAILLRYYETKGELRRAISVLKKRSSGHANTIRDFRLTSEGFRIGEPLRGFQGVLAGVSAGGGDLSVSVPKESV
ncbi:MAG TPA: ATPase domain-containing protein [Thermoanaerobaculia bacterium]|nr:ATPase domain-containing protein [Thermoanaerobaculia bacterium]